MSRYKPKVEISIHVVPMTRSMDERGAHIWPTLYVTKRIPTYSGTVDIYWRC